MFCPLCGEETEIMNHEEELMGSGKKQVLYDTTCDNMKCPEKGALVTVVWVVTLRANDKRH